MSREYRTVAAVVIGTLLGLIPTHREALGQGLQINIATYGACSGGDATAQVQNAIDALANGGTLLVSCKAGIGQGGVQLANKSNVTVRGTNGGGFKTLNTTTVSSISFLVSNCTQCLIETLDLDGNFINRLVFSVQNSHNTTVQNNHMYNAGGTPVQTYAIASAMGNRNNQYLNNTIERTIPCSMDNGTPAGLWVGNVQKGASNINYPLLEWYPIVSGNTFRRTRSTMLPMHAVAPTITNNTFEDNCESAATKLVIPKDIPGTTLVEGNIIRNMSIGLGMSQDEAPTWHPDRRVILRNNYMENIRGTGIFGGLPGRNMLITRNTIINAQGLDGFPALMINGGDNFEVSHNIIRGSVADGILFHGHYGAAEPNTNMVINCNEIDNGDGAGIGFGASTTVNGLTISNNTITNNTGYGINDEGPSTISNYSAFDNRYSGNTPGNARGVDPGEGTPSCGSSSSDTTPPTISLTTPAAGSTVSGTITVSANAADNVSVVNVQFKLDGANLGTADITAPYALQWDTKTIANGSQTLSAVARDAAGNQTTSSAVSVIVSNTAPVPTANIKANSQDGPITISSGTAATISWTSSNATSCSVSPSGWTGSSGSQSTGSLTSSRTYILTCTNANGSASDSVTVNVSLPGGGARTFVASYTPGTLVTGSYRGWTGIKLTVGASPLTITELGRLMLSGNTKTHTLKLINVRMEADVPGTTVFLSMAGGSVGQFRYAPLANPVTLYANTSYYFVSSEDVNVPDGDHFYDYDTPVTIAAVATIDHPVYFSEGWLRAGSPNHTYGPLNFKYTTGAPRSPIWGDVNDSGSVNSTDALIILNHVIGLPIGSSNISLADVNADSQTTSLDALIILYFSVGLNTGSSRVGTPAR